MLTIPLVKKYCQHKMLINMSNDKFKYHNMEMFRDPGVHVKLTTANNTLVHKVRSVLDLKFFEWSNYLCI